MPLPSTSNFQNAVLFVGDAATPTEAFLKTCGFAELTVEASTESGDTVVWDCDTPGVAEYVLRDTVSRSMTITGSGVYDKTTFDRISAAFNTGNARNCRFRIIGGGTGGGTPDLQFAGAFILSFSFGASRGSKSTLELTAVSAGAVTMTSVAT